jgi:hypothetical protein
MSLLNRNTYCNYGSYLRSRGVDSQICALNTLLNNSNLTNGGTVTGDLVVTGTLTVGTSTTTITGNQIDAVNLDVSTNAIVRDTLRVATVKSTNEDTTNDIIVDCDNFDISNAIIYRNLDLTRQANVFSETVSMIRLADITSFSVSNTATNTVCNTFGTSPSTYILYSNAKNSESIFLSNQPTNTNFIVDVSNNQDYFKDCIVEIYITAKVELGNENKTIDYTLFSFRSTDGSPTIEFVVDTRSFGKRASAVNVTYGPYTFLTTSSNYGILGRQYNIIYEAKITDGNGTLTLDMTEINVVFKQKFIN